MLNKVFLDKINDSFQVYLETGARSNEKLKVLHGFIAKALSDKLGGEYQIASLGYGDDKEHNIHGRYIDKNVDITVLKDNKPVAGVAVKFVMSNYSQNSNNYFENMLGETANIRCNGIPYFQILVLTNKAPYFKKDGTISKLEDITANNLRKYVTLSEDDATNYLHTPDKTLIYIVKNKSDTSSFVNESKENYTASFTGNSEFEICKVNGAEFGNNVVLNNFEEFVDKVTHRILSI